MLPIPSHWIPDMGAPRSLALLRLIVGRARRDWPLVAAAWVLLLSATALIGATAQEGRAATVLASYAGIERHARLIEGSWPNATGGPSATAPIDATLSAGAATSLGLKVGQEVRLTDSLDAGQATTVRVVG